METPLIHAPGNLHAYGNKFHNSFITQCQILAEHISTNLTEVTCVACINQPSTGERDEAHAERDGRGSMSGQGSLF